MKWAVVGLCLLGSIAAISAALLVNAMRAQAAMARGGSDATTRPADVTVLYANKSLPAMTVVESNFVTVKTMRPEEAPQHYISSPVDVVGKVLTRPIVEGQQFTTALFNDNGSAQQVAAVIPAGKRAVGISVTNYAGLEGLLYPGSVVDVLVSLKSSDTGEGTRREPFTATLLENIQVLAIEQQTVVSPAKRVSDMDNTSSRAGDSHCVTLLVDPQQAKALQLAMDQGVLSLALRNPLDSSNADKEVVWLQSLAGQDPFAVVHRPEPKTAEPVKVEKPAELPHWDTMIMRGGSVETRSFPMESVKATAQE